MNKKITFCAYDKPDSLGGPVTWLQLLLPALKERGLEVNCLILFHHGDTGPLYEHLSVHGISCKTTAYKPFTEDNIKWILSCLQTEPPHIFVPNLVVAAYYAVKWIRKAGIHTVGVSHSDDPFYHAIQKEFIDGQKDFRLSGMVCVSNELEKQLKASVYSGEVNIMRIPYGVHIPEGITSGRNTTLKVVYVGRLAEEQKRISEVAKAFCEMVKQVPNTQALIYGDGPDRANVEAILANEAKDLSVTLEGSIPANKVQEMLLDAHVIVLLSDFEGLPIAILEAMACGVVPVCLELKSGISEQIIQGVTGFVVKDRKYDFLDVIKKLESNHALWESVSINAKDYIKQHFTMVQCHDLWQQYFESFSSVEPGPIIIPDRIRLPKVNIDLARADRRQQFQVKTLYYKLRMKLGRYKRILLNQPIN